MQRKQLTVFLSEQAPKYCRNLLSFSTIIIFRAVCRLPSYLRASCLSPLGGNNILITLLDVTEVTAVSPNHGGPRRRR